MNWKLLPGPAGGSRLSEGTFGLFSPQTEDGGGSSVLGKGLDHPSAGSAVQMVGRDSVIL